MVTWGEKSDAQLLLTILKIHDIKINYEKVAEELSIALKENITKSAIMNRMFKLKTKAAGSVGSSEGGGGASCADGDAAAPAKKKGGRPRKNAVKGEAGEKPAAAAAGGKKRGRPSKKRKAEEAEDAEEMQAEEKKGAKGCGVKPEDGDGETVSDMLFFGDEEVTGENELPVPEFAV